MRILSSLPVLLITAFASIHCNKDDDGPPADSPSIIQVTQPTSGTIYLNGTNLDIQGTIEDANGLTTVKVEVRKAANNESLYEQSLSAGGVTFYNLDRDWTITGITSATNAKVKIIATDRYSYQVTKEVNIVLSD